MFRLFIHLLIFFVTFAIGSYFGSRAFQIAPFPQKGSQTPTEAEGISRNYDFFTGAPSPEPAFQTTARRERLERRPLTCSDRNILPIWRYLVKDERIYKTEYDTEQTPDCSKIVEVYYVDLNNDGKTEILVRGMTTPLCGGVGNCAFWIFQKSGNRFRILFKGNDYIDRSRMGGQVLRTRTKGYSDILVKGHFTAAHTGFYYLKFNGRKYRDAKCLYEVPNYDSKNNLSWKFVTCEQFFREQGL